LCLSAAMRIALMRVQLTLVYNTTKMPLIVVTVFKLVGYSLNEYDTCHLCIMCCVLYVLLDECDLFCYLTWWKTIQSLAKMVFKYSFVWKYSWWLASAGFMFIIIFSSNTEINRSETLHSESVRVNSQDIIHQFITHCKFIRWCVSSVPS
jgi:hypothetical protein